MSEDVAILAFIGGAFLVVVLMIVAGARLASRGKLATGPARHAEVDDDDLGSWRRSSPMDAAPYAAAGAVATLDGAEASAAEPGAAEDDHDGTASDDGGWDSSDSSSDSSDGGGGDSSSD